MGGSALRKQILIADSDQCFVRILAEDLQARGYDVLTAESFSGTVQKASVLDVDLILIGDSLSGSSGLELCKRVKNLARTERIPVIIVTEKTGTAAHIQALDSGADDCVTRQIDRDELTSRIEAVWRRGNGEGRRLREERQHKIILELAQIIREGRVITFFQPIYFLNPLRLFGLEVLSRPIDSQILVDSDDLFRAAIKFDMYYDLEMICWQKAVKSFMQEGCRENLFVNCSSLLIRQNILRMFTAIFDEANIPANNIVLEVNRNAMPVDTDRFVEIIEQFRSGGFSFAFDDVAGSSFETILQSSPEMVKIDRQVISDISQDPVKKSAVSLVVDFCRGRGILTIAEGVETREELNMVQALGVDAAQGYYLYKPSSQLNVREMKDVCIEL